MLEANARAELSHAIHCYNKSKDKAKLFQVPKAGGSLMLRNVDATIALVADRMWHPEPAILRSRLSDMEIMTSSIYNLY